LKREIPQKVDAKFGPADQVCSASVARFCATLFRRTRSASLLSFTLTAGTLGVLLPHQKAEAFPKTNPAPLGAVPSLPHLFNSADTLSKSYPSFNYLDTQGGVTVLPTDNNVVASNIIFQSNDGLASDLQLQTLPNSLELSNATRNTALVPTAEVQSTDRAEAIATAPQIPEAQASALPEGLADEAPKPLTFVHKVELGENLTAIADRYKVSPEAIVQTNGIANPNVIAAHADLVIPTASLSAVVATPLMLGTLAKDTKAILDESDHQGIAAKLLEPDQSGSQPVRLPLVPAMKQQDSEESRLESPQNTQAAESAGPLVQPQPANLAFHGTQQQYQSSSRLEVTYPLAATSVVARRVAFPQMPSLDLPSLASADQFLPSTLQGGGFQKYIWPARGTFTSGFGYRWGRMHKGIDIAAPVGTPVVAAAAGVVASAGWNEGGYGNLVEVRHPDGSLTIYAHNSRITTRVGAIVNQGELIAQMGSTGRSTGPHTHFEIRPRGSGAVNPMFFLARS
jgi:murein DD-endopeptidase MepM/ murein hydrolase activator NlpD